jgi:hypothetical protein
MHLYNHTLYPATIFETTEPIIDIHRVNKQVHHTREWVGKHKKHNYLVCIYTFREAVELGGASGAMAQVTQNDAH